MGFILTLLYVVVALSPLLFVAGFRMQSELTVLHDPATSLALAVPHYSAPAGARVSLEMA